MSTLKAFRLIYAGGIIIRILFEGGITQQISKCVLLKNECPQGVQVFFVDEVVFTV